ncbi:DUF397 domain-containing protein [Streptomyces sp. NPDC058067]|uniref:DUF397 domain-containing protein n=1 Tax=Streptomyces sp. NPDC058067 TaxID=3346324 RepID=UPI0036EC2BAD
MAPALVWQKSSFSGDEDAPNCLELATHEGAVLLRESDAPDDVLRTPPEALAGLIRRVRQVGPAA